MAYSDFTLEKVKQSFQLSINQRTRLFSTVKPYAISDMLAGILEENIPLASAMNTRDFVGR